jgi:aspartate aminotransferase-like enzyme
MTPSKKTLCMNPGPIEFEHDVLSAFAHEGISHVDPAFIEVFGQCLENMRKVSNIKRGSAVFIPRHACYRFFWRKMDNHSLLPVLARWDGT